MARSSHGYAAVKRARAFRKKWGKIIYMQPLCYTCGQPKANWAHSPALHCPDCKDPLAHHIFKPDIEPQPTDLKK
jgi:predicted amidophosphoribosyltransferase